MIGFQESLSRSSRDWWLLYDVAVNFFMLLALVFYAVLIADPIRDIPSDFSIYDSKGNSKARLLLPRKISPANATVSTRQSYPGGPGRWQLETDNSGSSPLYFHPAGQILIWTRRRNTDTGHLSLNTPM